MSVRGAGTRLYETNCKRVKQKLIQMSLMYGGVGWNGISDQIGERGPFGGGGDERRGLSGVCRDCG